MRVKEDYHLRWGRRGLRRERVGGRRRGGELAHWVMRD